MGVISWFVRKGRNMLSLSSLNSLAMKTIALSLITFCFITTASFAQYNCSKYYPFSEGATSQLSMYDKKGKLSVIVEYRITNVTSTGNSEVATMIHRLIDEKGNLVSSSEYDITCKDGVASLDFKSLSNQQMLQQFGDVDYEITGTNIELPNDLSVGQNLPDAGINIKISMEGTSIMNMNISITDRNVIGKETVTTPAGTFECFVISSTTVMKMGTNMTSKSKQWIAEGVGVVKTEDYDKKGKLRGSGLLTSFSK